MIDFGELRSLTEAGKWGRAFELASSEEPEAHLYALEKYLHNVSLSQALSEGRRLEGVEFRTFLPRPEVRGVYGFSIGNRASVGRLRLNDSNATPPPQYVRHYVEGEEP